MKTLSTTNKTRLCLIAMTIGTTATLVPSQTAMTLQSSTSSVTTTATQQTECKMSAEEQAKVKALAETTRKSNAASLWFANSKGEKIEGIIRPATTKTDTVLILSHSLLSHKNSPTFNALANALNLEGISLFGFDFYGHGTRGRDVTQMTEAELRAPSIDLARFKELTPSMGVDDLRSAIEMLKKQGYSKFILMGSSFGGLVSIIVASQLPKDVIGLILKAPQIDVVNGFGGVGKPESWQKQGFINLFVGKLGYCFYEDSTKYNTYELAKKIQCPVRLMHSEKDEYMLLEDSQRFCHNLPNGELIVMKGANHRYTNEQVKQAGAQFEAMVQTSADFARIVTLQANLHELVAKVHQFAHALTHDTQTQQS